MNINSAIKKGDICIVTKSQLLVKVICLTLSQKQREVALVELLEPAPYCNIGDLVGYETRSLTLLDPLG